MPGDPLAGKVLEIDADEARLGRGRLAPDGLNGRPMLRQSRRLRSLADNSLSVAL